MHLPAQVFVPKVQAFYSFQGLALLETEWAVLGIGINEALKSVKVTSIVWNECSGIAPLKFQGRHLDPSLIKYIKFFTVCHHLFLIIAASDYVDEAITEVIVRCERSPTNANAWHSFDCLRREVEDEGVTNGSVLWDIYIIAWNDKHFIVGDVNGASKLELFIEALSLDIIFIFRLQILPFLAIVRIQLIFVETLHVLNDAFELSVHYVTAWILIKTVLLFCVRSVAHTYSFNIVRDDIVVELSRYELHAQFFLVGEVLDNLVEDVERFGNRFWHGVIVLSCDGQVLRKLI